MRWMTWRAICWQALPWRWAAPFSSPPPCGRVVENKHSNRDWSMIGGNMNLISYQLGGNLILTSYQHILSTRRQTPSGLMLILTSVGFNVGRVLVLNDPPASASRAVIALFTPGSFSAASSSFTWGRNLKLKAKL